MDLDEIKVEPSSNPRHEKTPVDGASSVPQDESRGLNEMTPEELDSLKKQVYKYARHDKWKEAEPIFNKYGEMVRIPFNSNEDTILHLAVEANSINFVKGLVNLMTPQDLELQNDDGATGIDFAARTGNSDIVQIMIKENPNLPLFKPDDSEGYWLPVYTAACNGHHKIVQDLSSKTLLQKMDMEDIQKLFFQTIESHMFDVATKLFEEHPAVFAIAKYAKNGCEPSTTALERLMLKPSKKLGDSYSQLLQKVWLQLNSQLGWKGIFELIGTSSLVSAIAYALESGSEWAEEQFSNKRLLSLRINSNEQTVMHYAVRQRHRSFVSYLINNSYFGKFDALPLAVDKDGNNVLHLAAYPLEGEENSSSLRASTKMKKEVAWFKDMEELFAPELRKMTNKKGKTPKDVFQDKHKDLSREVKDTAKGIADSGMTVAALVAAVAFAAALTVPGDKTNPSFNVFILANAAALFTSSASIVSFLSNFTTSRFADSEFVIALHPSLVLGPLLLLISIVTMVISFAAASFLIFEHTSKWIAYVVTSMGVFPILLFLLFQFNIFDKHLWSKFYHMSYAQ